MPEKDSVYSNGWIREQFEAIRPMLETAGTKAWSRQVNQVYAN